MPPVMLLLFNHQLTEEQREEARDALGVERFVSPPEAVKALWAKVPPELPALDQYLQPVRNWLNSAARPDDLVLVEGDFGATFLTVLHAIRLGLRPVYAATRRDAKAVQQPDGSVQLTHRFRHCRFRTYGE